MVGTGQAETIHWINRVVSYVVANLLFLYSKYYRENFPTITEKNQDRYDNDVRKRLKKIEKNLEITTDKVYDNYRGLGAAALGDVQRTRNAFIHHKTMMRCYQFMLPHVSTRALIPPSFQYPVTLFTEYHHSH